MNNFEKIKLKHFPLSIKPQNACIGITTRCNGSCKMCKIHSIDPPIELSFKQLQKIIDNLANFGVKHIVLLGGEPLLHKDLEKIADYIKNKGLTCSLITNGTLVNKENIKKLKERFTHIEVSLDGSSKEINDKVRFKGSFEGAMETTRLMKDHKISFNIRFTIQKDNVRDIVNFVKLTEDQQLPLLLSLVEISGYGNSPTKELQEIELNSLKKAIDFIEKTRPKFLWNNFEALRFVYQKLNGLRNKVICYAPFTWMPIFADGSVYPCSVIEEKLGNILRQPIEKIYFSQHAESIRKSILCKNNSICDRCIHLCELNESFNNTFSYWKFLKNYLGFLKRNVQRRFQQ